MTDRNTKATLAALIVNIIFGFSFMFSKIALRYAHPLVILSVRFTVAFLCLNLLWLTGIVKMSFRGKPRGRLLLMALAQPMLYFSFELYGVEHTSSAISGVIISLVPVAVIVLSTILLREKPTLSQVLFSLLSLSAIVAISLLSDNTGENSLFGILLLLLAVFADAVYIILSRSESAHYSPFERTYIMFLVGTVGFNLMALLSLRGGWFGEVLSAVTKPSFWGAILYLSVLSSIVAFMLSNYSTSVLTPVRTTSFSNLITLVSVLAGVFIMGESLSLPQLVCCALIVVGVVGVNRQQEG